MKIYVLIFFSFCLISVNAQENWLNTIGGDSFDNTTSMAIDRNGNLIIVGGITNTAFFSDESITGTDDHSSSRYIAKYHTDNGALIWVKKVADSITFIESLTIDVHNNILITGNIGDDYNTDFFVAKYDSNGVKQWIRTGMGNGVNRGNGIETINDDIYIIGYFHDTAVFCDTAISAPSGGSLFFAKYSSSGDLAFIKQPFNRSKHPVDLQKDSSNNLYILCNVWGVSDTIGITVTKFDTSNELLWEKYYYGFIDYGYSNYIEASSLSIYDSNNILICGNFRGEIYSNTDTLSSIGENDYFVSCFDYFGELKWINHDMSSEFANSLNTITVTEKFDIYSIGYFENILVFNNDSSINALGNCNTDILIARYDSVGNLISVNVGGNDGIVCDFGEDIISIDSSVFFSGQFGGSGFFGNAMVQSNGQNDVVFGKYDELVSWGIPTSIKINENLPESIIVYPIPIRDKLHIENIPIDNKEIIILIINSYGQLILKHQNIVDANIVNMDMKGVPKGLYFIQIISNGKKTTHKIIKN